MRVGTNNPESALPRQILRVHMETNLMPVGSSDEVDEYSNLPPEEAKRRLAVLVQRMDLNSNGYVDKQELQLWIENSFK